MRAAIPSAGFFLVLFSLTACSDGAGSGGGGGGGGGGGDDGGPDAITGEPKPEALPDLAAVGLYAETSPLNTPIPLDARVDPDSDAYVTKLVTAQPFLLNLRSYSTAVYVADASATRYDVPVRCGEAWELGVSALLDVPIPGWAEPAEDDPEEAPPSGCGEDSGQDNNMVVLDLESRCEYDFWQMRIEDGRWVASWGNAIGLDSGGIYASGLSTRGSGFAFLGGHVWPDELRRGRIEHALVFAYPFTRAGGPVAPATDSDGESADPDALPEGARLQLDPGLDLDALGLAGAERTIAKALQEYGMYLVDNGGDSGIGLYIVDPRSVRSDPYEGILPNETFPTLDGIPLDALRVLELPAQDGAWQATLGLTQTGCNAFR